MSHSISVVIPYFNDSSRIKRTIDSVFMQTLMPNELIIIDDASDDSEKLLQIVENHRYFKKIVLYRNSKNRNAAACRNQGIQLAKSNYIALLDADDYWLNEHIESSFLGLIENSCDFVYSNVVKDKNGAKKIKKVHGPHKVDKTIADCLFGSPPQTNSFFFIKEIHQTIKFDERLYRHQDFQFFLDMLYSNFNCKYVDISTSVLTISNRSLKSRIHFDSIFLFWSSKHHLFTSKLLNNYMEKIICYLFIFESNKIEEYLDKYKCLEDFKARKDMLFFKKLGFVKFHLLFAYYFKTSFFLKRVLISFLNKY